MSAVAEHEAAHAVVGYVLGEALVSVTVVPTLEARGLCQFAPAPSTEVAAEAWLRNQLIIALAGRAMTGGDGAAGDDDNVYHCARQLAGSAPEDAPVVAQLITDAYDEAKTLVEDWRFAIGDLAKYLDCWGTLEGEHLARTVAEIVEQDRANPWKERGRQTNRKAREWLRSWAEGGGTDDDNS